MIEMITKKSPEGMTFRICSDVHGYTLQVKEGSEWTLIATGLTWEEANIELEMNTNEDVDFEEYNRIMNGR